MFVTPICINDFILSIKYKIANALRRQRFSDVLESLNADETAGFKLFRCAMPESLWNSLNFAESPTFMTFRRFVVSFI